MLAYVNTELSRDEVIARVEGHRKADELRAGIGWENGVGCAVGCTLHTYDHRLYPAKIGHPEHLAYLEDTIFEGLHQEGETELGNAWPTDYLSAAAYGADLSMVWPKWCLWMLDGLGYDGNQQVADVIKGVRDLYAEWIDTGTQPSHERFEAAVGAAWAAWAAGGAGAAWAAAAWAAWAAAAEAVGAAAVEAVGSAEAVGAAAVGAAEAAGAAWAAAVGAAEAAGRRDFWLAARVELLRLMNGAPNGLADAAMEVAE